MQASVLKKSEVEIQALSLPESKLIWTVQLELLRGTNVFNLLMPKPVRVQFFTSIIHFLFGIECDECATNILLCMLRNLQRLHSKSCPSPLKYANINYSYFMS